MAVQPVPSPIHLTHYLVPSKSEDKVWVVEQAYSLKTGEVSYRCQCRGWNFNKKCHHVTATRLAFRSGKAGGSEDAPLLLGVGE